MISVIVPVFNEENNVLELHRKINAELVLLGRPYEIIMIDDGSIDATYEKLKSLSPLVLLRMRRNYGQASAMDAGFRVAEGEIIVTMDGDLQNDPRDISNLVAKIEEGFDVVSGWRVNRQDSIFRKTLSKFANWVTYKISGLYLHDTGCALKAYRAEFLQDVHLYGGMHSFLPAYLYGMGAKVTELPVHHHERTSGKSKYGFTRIAKLFADLVTIKFLSEYVSQPMLFFGGFSLMFLGFGFLSFLAATILKLLEIKNYVQTPLPIFSVTFVIIGFLLFMMGFLGELMLRIYCETRGKKTYLIKDKVINKSA